MIFHYKSPSIVTVRTTHTQGAPVHTPGPEVPGGCVNSWSLILDSLTDPRGHQEDAFLVVVTKPLMRETPLPPRKVHVGVWKGSLFTSLPPWTWVPTPSPPGRKQLQAWLHAVWHESHRMEKKKKEYYKQVTCSWARRRGWALSPDRQTRASLPGSDPGIKARFLYFLV